MIKYRYARGANQTRVNVTALTSEARYENAPYTCFGCGGELIANLGAKKIKHFSHKGAHACRPESYLHKLAKHAFFDIYSECLREGAPFFLVQDVPAYCDHFQKILGRACTIGHERKHDLTRFFPKIRLEVPFKGVVPDILLQSADGQEQLFVEMAVTHHCDYEKRNLGVRIVEIT